MARPIRARINLAAVERNYGLLGELSPGAKVVAVVKADGYGHGAVEVARALASRADAFGVASLGEALALREAGLTEPILLMAGFFAADELAELAARRLDTVVHSAEQLELLLAASLPRPLRVWLKLDTGMHRLGLPRQALADAYHRLRAAPQVSSIVLMSHFASADQRRNDLTRRQTERFDEWTGDLEGDSSLANTAALLAWPGCHGDWVRPGLLLYGLSPLDRPNEAAARLEPVMELTSEVIAIRPQAAGDAIGYGGRYVCPRDTRIAVVAAGYADGYPRHAPDGTPVLVGGRRAPIAGRVSMDLITIDLDGLDQVAVGDPVELWGREVSAREIADACGTISYELFTGVTARVPRLYRR